MGSLDAKLKGGMSVFNRAESDAPSFLKSYWLAPDPPLWKRYEEEPKFVPRLQLLRGYLAHKVLIMDVVEASQPEDLDTKEAVARIARTCEAVSPNEAYGVEQAQRIAIEALYDRWFTHRFTAAVTPVSRVIMKQYPPEAATPELAMAISGLFAIGDRLDADEWGWLVRTPTTGPAMRRGLEVRDHGKPETRRARLREALERTLAGAESKVRPRRFEHVFPSDGTFLLSVEAELPADLKAHLDWEFLKELFERSERRMTHAEAQAYLDRMAVALRALPVDAKARRARCTGLADDLKFLWQHDRPTDTFGETVCACLTDGLGDDSLTLVNKHDLYERALGEKLACVAPLP